MSSSLPMRACARVAALPWLTLGLALTTAGCTPAVLDAAGPIGKADTTILIDSLAIMLAIVVPTVCATLGVAWWFRASNTRARCRPDWAYSGQIELVVWAIPVMVIILLGGVTWIGSHRLDPAVPLPANEPPLKVQVVSLDWKWLFIYPDLGIATVNRLVVPVGVPVRFSLTSASVMNTFFIPRLGSMIYTMNGMSTELNLRADEPGTYRGISGHYSGEGFSDMHFDVQALPAAQFAAWRNGSQGPMLDAASYAALARQSVAVAPSSYGGVEAGLYDKVVRQQLAPGAGPGAVADGAMQAPLAAH